ncbi:MAG: hypothetical protein ABUL72_02780, partial [Armatimonadota bacterium]
MIRPITFHGIDFNLLSEAWRRFYPQRFWVTPKQIEHNTVNHSLLDWGCSLATVRDDRVSSFIAVKKSAAPHLFYGPDPDQAHITAMAFEDPCEMVDLLANVKSALRQRGIFRIVFGADHGHFFPGIPSECTTLRNFLEIEGFEVDDKGHVDLERDMADYTVPTWVQPALASVVIRRSEASDVKAVDAFLNQTFPGRWRYDVLRRMVEEGRPEDVLLMEVDGSVQGFAFTQVSTGPLPIGGAVWHLDMGDKWGSLGPIGIGTAVRGKKLGHAMLAVGLAGLHEAGVRRCIIDWTTLVDFYGA